jgi:hypothetical protein
MSGPTNGNGSPPPGFRRFATLSFRLLLRPEHHWFSRFSLPTAFQLETCKSKVLESKQVKMRLPDSIGASLAAPSAEPGPVLPARSKNPLVPPLASIFLLKRRRQTIQAVMPTCH